MCVYRICLVNAKLRSFRIGGDNHSIARSSSSRRYDESQEGMELHRSPKEEESSGFELGGRESRLRQCL